MVILDTDHLSLLDLDTAEAITLGVRLAQVARKGEQVAVTIVTYEEQMRGWLAYLARADTQTRQLDAYAKLHRHIETFQRIPLIDYDRRAAETFTRLQNERVRIGTMDLKIASIALSQGALLVSRNFVDFRKVPGLRLEDWTI